MDASTNIVGLFTNNVLGVPDYQRAYSWDAEREVATFWADLQDYVKSGSEQPYYLGHFLFEETTKMQYQVIDGQQRLTTITILACALFARLEQLRALTPEEKLLYGNVVRVGETYHFSTVGYDNQLLRDYVVNRVKKDRIGLDSVSQKRIVKAYDYFTKQLEGLGEGAHLPKAMFRASCTTHTVKDEAEAIQMFIFQNNRGKRLTNLELIKAEFLYTLHLQGGAEREELIKEVRGRFERIYTSISRIEDRVDEDDILAYTNCVYFENLEANKEGAKKQVLSGLKKGVEFVMEFTRCLSDCFEKVETFIELERKAFYLHSLLEVADRAIMFPFMIKALKFAIPAGDLERLARALESIFIRNMVIGTRAELTSRFREHFKNFDGNVEPIIKCIKWMKAQKQGWWCYWRDEEFSQALVSVTNHYVARKLLWEYENLLRKRDAKAGYYEPLRWGQMEDPNLEHIAPKTENEAPSAGYDTYDEAFRNECLESLGNYLLLSDRHNKSIGNCPFAEKRASYQYLAQQREVQDMTDANAPHWGRKQIEARQARIVEMLLEAF
jgi:hypothetical protein